MTTIYLPFNSWEKFDPGVTPGYSFIALKVVRSPSDSHCLIHAVLCCVRCRALKAMPSIVELVNLVKFEVLNNIDYYRGFFNFTKTDFVEELDSNISMNQCSSGTIAVVQLELANTLRCCRLCRRREKMAIMLNELIVISTQHGS